ncbi:MAG: hypothetical protein EA348_05970 [Pseudomonadaceae bacterium]|nr:MAG: hypothetical protein EA348_05970 [Pseudomonadaceae bacterium]
MQLSQLRKARRQHGDVVVEIVSHSCLSGFLARVRLRTGEQMLLRDQGDRPKVWLALDQLKRDLRRQGVTATELSLCVAQDEVIRQPGMPAQRWDC